MDALARVLSDLKNMGHQVILVSSGAIGVGAGKLGLNERPTELRFKQAAAAAGQCELMHLYDKFFAEYGQTVAQILLTGEDVEHPVRAEHLTGTFEALLELGCIPVVNENDSVSAAEIETGQRKVLGDNDTLSAIVAGLCRADLLVLLSDIDGLYDADPRKDRSAKLIHRVEAITPEIEALAGGGGTKWGTGGMYTKLTAAKRSMAHGIDMVIANSNKLDALYDIVEGGDVGTRFAAK
jgi:glutamate 5-kinase